MNTLLTNSLPEHKLLTIEALNKIKGFIWPVNANFAAFGSKVDPLDNNKSQIYFYSDKPTAGQHFFEIENFDPLVSFNPSVSVPDKHPSWQDSLICKDDFFSINGWIRTTPKNKVGYPIVDLIDHNEQLYKKINIWDQLSSIPDLTTIKYWRHHKEQNTINFIPDLKDLQIGDVVSWSILSHLSEFKIVAIHHDPSREIGDFEIEDSSSSFRAYFDELKFVRRPIS